MAEAYQADVILDQSIQTGDVGVFRFHAYGSSFEAQVRVKTVAPHALIVEALGDIISSDGKAVVCREGECLAAPRFGQPSWSPQFCFVKEEASTVVELEDAA
jgi:hypothetical protein